MINKTKGTKAIVVAVVSLAFVSATFAQQAIKPPVNGTYYSAKDFDWSPPWPFNPHPELDVVEIAPGIFIYDDTAIPDTPEQAESRKQKQEADALAKAIATDPVLAAAVRQKAEDAAKAAQEALDRRIQKDFVPWLHTDQRFADGNVADEASRSALIKANLLTLSEKFTQKADQNKQAVKEFLSASRFDPFTRRENGSISAIVSIENGLPQAVETFNSVAADTVGTDELWPGGDTGLNLTGTNVAIGLWDGGDVRITHQEFSTNGVRVIDIDGPSTYGINDHPTHVSGTLAAYGVINRACGMAHRGRIYAGDFDFDIKEMPGAVATNGFHVSNHSYGYQRGWGYMSIGGTIYMTWWGDVAVDTSQDFQFGFYSAESQAIDQIANAASTYLPVWAAANERGSSGAPIYPPSYGYYTFSNRVMIISTANRPNDGDVGGYDTLPQHSCAKNVLTVGAVNGIINGYAGSNSVVMSTFSSFGPTDDGRIKPDIVADGVNLYSSVATDDSSYAIYSGTSMATPNTCGSLALLIELHGFMAQTSLCWHQP